MISVIIPVYNIEKYLRKCIESVLCQEGIDLEVILVDDGSTDNSGIICDEFALKDKRVNVLHKKNGGLSSARNVGTICAKGEYISYIDGDDYIEPDYFKILYQNAIDYQAQVSVCNYRLVWDDEESILEKSDKKIVTYTGRDATAKIVKNNSRYMISAWGKLYHKSLKEVLVYPEGKLHEDEFVTYKVLYKAKNVVVTEEAYYAYVQRRDSIMNSSFNKKRLDKLDALEEAILFFEKCGEEELKIIAQKRYLLSIQIAWYRVNKYLKEDKETAHLLRKRWQVLYDSSKKDILKECSIVDWISVLVYKISPIVYGIIAEIVLKLFPEV